MAYYGRITESNPNPNPTYRRTNSPGAPAPVGKQEVSLPTGRRPTPFQQQGIIVPKRNRPFLRGFSGLINPVDDMGLDEITSDFGSRTHPITGRHSNHTGVDIARALGTPIRAVNNGIVGAANVGDSVYGNQLILEHGRNKQSMYGHLSKLLVKPGQRIRRGEVIGLMGSTGLSTGSHLHLETWINGDPVNPVVILGR